MPLCEDEGWVSGHSVLQAAVTQMGPSCSLVSSLVLQSRATICYEGLTGGKGAYFPSKIPSLGYLVMAAVASSSTAFLTLHVWFAELSQPLVLSSSQMPWFLSLECTSDSLGEGVVIG